MHINHFFKHSNRFIRQREPLSSQSKLFFFIPSFYFKAVRLLYSSSSSATAGPLRGSVGRYEPIDAPPDPTTSLFPRQKSEQICHVCNCNMIYSEIHHFIIINETCVGCVQAGGGGGGGRASCALRTPLISPSPHFKKIISFLPSIKCAPKSFLNYKHCLN